MFCPRCKDEFRPGFTRCSACNVDLVASLASAAPRAPSSSAAPAGPVRMAEYCGFLSLDEARAARDRLRGQQIGADIVIRESPDADLDQPVHEEYWLRVDASCASKVASVVGAVPEIEAATGAGSFGCGACGHMVPEDAVRCPGCGAHFDD